MNIQYIQKHKLLILYTAFFLLFLIYIFIFSNIFHFKEGIENNVIISKEDAFCESHRGKSGVLEDSCGKLTEKNCNSTSCCVWASPGKCVAGNKNGPTFNSDDRGKTIELDYYYYQNKCYGKKC